MHFQHGAVTVLHIVLHIPAANTFGMFNSQQITSQLSYLQDQ
jgi:hypothetical protein